jgi:hypothetical protein
MEGSPLLPAKRVEQRPKHGIDYALKLCSPVNCDVEGNCPATPCGELFSATYYFGSL